MMTDSSALTTHHYAPASGVTKRLVILLHGLGADGPNLIGLGAELTDALPDTGFLAPDAPFACDMYPEGRQWFSLQSRAEEDLEREVKLAAPIVNDYIDAQMAQHQVTSDKVALIGFSQGTMTALYTALRRPDALAAIVGFSGAMVAAAKLPREITARPPVCLIHGDADPVVPFAAMAVAQRALEASGVAVTAHARTGLEHSIDAQGLDIARHFLQKHLN